MKLTLEIDLAPHLTAEESKAFREQCRLKEKPPEVVLVEIIRAALKETPPETPEPVLAIAS